MIVRPGKKFGFQFLFSVSVFGILHSLATIHPLQTTTDKQTTTDDYCAKDTLQHSKNNAIKHTTNPTNAAYAIDAPTKRIG